MKLKTLTLALSLSVGAMTYAHDFATTIDGQNLYFDITGKSRKTVAVTYEGSIADHKAPTLSGTVVIPSKVKHDGVTYQVTSIGAKAFANAHSLKGVVIPAGIEAIGDFAFENCDSLTAIVFPGNEVKRGQGVFFNCTAITDVTIGSDWTAIDLTMFRWSKELRTIHIPAKIAKISGFKKLNALTSITVDPNNANFSSAEGLLYSKDGSILYACPRAYEGKVSIKEGTKTVAVDALIDCENVTALDIPESVTAISFRETARMSKLEYIVMRASKPFTTAFFNNNAKFFFQLPKPDVSIIVPSKAKEKYDKVLPTKSGEYSNAIDSVPYTVELSELPTADNIKGVKNFKKY